MAKLFQATQVAGSLGFVNPATTLYLNTTNVLSAASVAYTNVTGGAATGTTIAYKAFDNTQVNTYTVSEAVSTINTRMNAANTTDVNRLGLTAIDENGNSFAQSVNVNDVWLVQIHPLSLTQSLVVTLNPTKTATSAFRCSNAASAVAASANA
tara:strand:+ start:2408 stop:2866 length:459 start_codon:yes stop_codon:yes gene_type:complete